MIALCGLILATFAATAAMAGGATSVPLTPVGTATCRAQAPSGWKVAASYEDANLTVVSADGHMAASLDIVPVGQGMVEGFYGPNFSTPAVFAEFLASEVAATDVDPSGTASNFNGMLVIHFESTKGASRNASLAKVSGVSGFEIYRAFPMTNEPGGYLFVGRLAVGRTPQEVATAAAVASSMTCDTKLKPQAMPFAGSSLQSVPWGTSASCKAGRCDDGDVTGAYAASLGAGLARVNGNRLVLVDLATVQPAADLQPGRN